MRKCLRIYIVSCFFILFLSPAVFPFEGPVQALNRFPLFLQINAPYLESAAAEDSFSAGFSHSSVFMIKNSTEWSVNLDMEISALDLRYRKVLPHLFELGIDIPVISFNSGVMDSALSSFHKTFSFPDYGRSSRPVNEFLYEVRKNGNLVLKGKNGATQLGDIRLIAKKVLITGDPVISARAELELPTGEASSGFGSGSLDGGVSVLINKKLGEKFMSYINLGVIFPGELKAQNKVELREVMHGGAGIEAALWKNFSLLGQVYLQTSPYTKTGIGTVDRMSALLSFGGRYSSGSNSFEFSFSEDPNTAGAPDITFNFCYKRKLQ